MSVLLNYDSPNALKAYLEMHSMGMQKKFGQNFLINPAIRAKLLDALDIDSLSHVWEIGPGLGAMTEGILKRGCTVHAFEIDRGFILALKELFADYADHFVLIEGDVFKTWFPFFNQLNSTMPQSLPNRFFGNLPYNIAATIIADFIEHNVRFDTAVITIQKEVALRMTAKPDTSDYSSFSVLCQWAYEVKTIVDISASSFWPRPHVDSRAVKLIKREEFPRCINPQLFMKMQRSLFVSRRKTIKNNLTAFAPTHAIQALEAADIDPSIRAECLSVDRLLALSDILHEYIHKEDAYDEK